MIDNEDILDRVMDRVVGEIVKDLKTAITQSVEEQVTKTLSRTLLESEFYRRINDDMRSGLQDIYREISSATKSNTEEAPTDKRQADKLFHEAADQLDKILQTTETATTEIMDIVEKHQSMQAEANKILHSLKSGGVTKEQLTSLREVSDVLNQDLLQIMTTLGFQDITGQRIKRIIEAIKKVEGIVFDLYMTTGIKLKARETMPDRDIEQLELEAKEKVTQLKGPQMDTNQSDVDDLLAQLGLE